MKCMANKNRTGTARQQRRRQREKEWLAVQGWKSWEALHTSLVSGKTRLTLVKDTSSKTNNGSPVDDSAEHGYFNRIILLIKKSIK